MARIPVQGMPGKLGPRRLWNLDGSKSRPCPVASAYEGAGGGELKLAADGEDA